MKSQEFRSKYLHTLKTDLTTKETYIQLPVADLDELAYMQESLLDTLLLLTQLEAKQFKSEQTQKVIYWLCRILLASYPATELEGISQLLKT